MLRIQQPATRSARLDGSTRHDEKGGI